MGRGVPARVRRGDQAARAGAHRVGQRVPHVLRSSPTWRPRRASVAGTRASPRLLSSACTRDRSTSRRLSSAAPSRSPWRSMRATNSSRRATTRSAAADGVGARRSATKSAMVTSVSCPTAGDHRHRARGDGPRHDFLVERPEILDRPAAAPDDHDIDAVDPRDHPQAARDVLRGALALDARRTNHDMRLGIALGQHRQDVANRRAVKRGDHADLARQHRQRPLARRIEQPGGLEPLLQLLERQLQRAEALGLERLAHDLVFALGVVDAHAGRARRRAGRLRP